MVNMRLIQFIISPNLRAILIAITVYWFCFLYYSILSSPANSSLLIFFLVWLILFAGINAKVKGFKVANGIVSTSMFIMSTYSLLLVGESLIEFGLNLRIIYSIPMIIVLLSSGYTAYATLMSKCFKLMYSYTEEVSVFSKYFFKGCLVVFIVIIGVYVIIDLVRM